MVNRVEKLLLVLLLVLMIPSAALGANSQASSWAQEAVSGIQQNQLADNNLFNAYQQNITRGEFCMMAVKLYEKARGTAPIPPQSPFQDISDSPYKTEILKASELKIVNGVGDAKFAPKGEITREQIAVMFYNTLKAIYPDADYSTTADLTFKDDDKIADWSRNAVTYCYKSNIMSGIDTLTIGPKQNATREQAMTLQYRVALQKGIIEKVSISTQQVQVHFIDVGQGDSIFIDYGDYDILIDAGENNYGQAVTNYLKSLNTDDIEIMVATHPDSDHIGGLDDVLRAFEVEKVIDSGTVHTTKTYEDYMAAVTAEGGELLYDDDMTFNLGSGLVFEIIETGDDNGDKNSNSVISRLNYNDIEFLFTGDIGQEVEQKILNKDIQAEILKVGHHGSKYSTDLNFLQTVKPEVAIISAGIDNSYGHPHAETLTNLSDNNTAIYGTYKSGTIIVTTNGKSYSLDTNTTVNLPGPKAPNEIATPEAGPSSGQVVINGIDLEGEEVIIKNTSASDIDMTGWSLVSVTGSQTYYFPAGYRLKAGSIIKIVSGRGAAGNGVSTLKWTGSYIWNNDGDPGELYNSSGRLVSTYPL